MTRGGSMLLLVVGAILFFAMDARWGSVNMDVVGVILMVAGGLGLVLTMFLTTPASLWHRGEPRVRH